MKPTRFETFKKWGLKSLMGILLLAIIFVIAFQISPWPGALVIRQLFNKGGIEANKQLEPYTPNNIASITNQKYIAANKNALLDVYFPDSIANTSKALPVIIWVHGGAWISGSKNQIANYCKIMASKGFTVVAIDYSIAPEAGYPTPLVELQMALSYLQENADRLHIDITKIFFAGDSAGSHIAAQTAAIITDSSYAVLIKVQPANILPNQIKGMLLYCGPYDTKAVNLGGSFGVFLNNVLWSYSGTKNFMENEYFQTANIINYVTKSFPPSFISVGNADPLALQSKKLAERLMKLQVPVDTLFFSSTYQPALQHEYQFTLDVAAGKESLNRSVSFLYKQLQKHY